MPIKLRPLDRSDVHRGHRELLSQLSTVDKVGELDWQRQYDAMFGAGNSTRYVTLVAVDSDTDRVVGSATLLLERKFLHSCGTAGHIEDVVVHVEYRGRQLGTQLVLELVRRARDEHACYKVTLYCSEDMVPFYKRIGLRRRGVQMAQYFEG